MTCAQCFRELADIDVSLGEMPLTCVHRRCLEDWLRTPDGKWHSDTTQRWASWLNGNMARVVQGKRGCFWYQVFNAQEIIATGRGDSSMEAMQLAERAAT